MVTYIEGSGPWLVLHHITAKQWLWPGKTKALDREEIKAYGRFRCT